MEERLGRLEEAVAVLQAENNRLREQVEALQSRLEEDHPATVAVQTPAQRRFSARSSVMALVALLALVPLLALSVLHMNAFQSTAVGALNALLLYIVGPGAWRLLVEGLVRAIPGVLFGQATRIAVDKWRQGGPRASG